MEHPGLYVNSVVFQFIQTITFPTKTASTQFPALTKACLVSKISPETSIPFGSFFWIFKKKKKCPLARKYLDPKVSFPLVSRTGCWERDRRVGEISVGERGHQYLASWSESQQMMLSHTD